MNQRQWTTRGVLKLFVLMSVLCASLFVPSDNMSAWPNGPGVAIHGPASSYIHAANHGPAASQLPLRFQLDPSQSKFIARARRGGLLWFKGHDHYLAAKRFRGVVEMTPDAIIPASLELRVDANSLEETSDVFTAQEKQIINKEVREIVLEPEKFPEILFQSTGVTSKAVGGNQYELKISGNLTLHGVTKPIVIPARVTLNGNQIRAVGEFGIERSDFKVKATSAVHGLVRVRDKVKFTFDIVGNRV